MSPPPERDAHGGRCGARVCPMWKAHLPFTDKDDCPRRPAPHEMLGRHEAEEAEEMTLVIRPMPTSRTLQLAEQPGPGATRARPKPRRRPAPGPRSRALHLAVP